MTAVKPTLLNRHKNSQRNTGPDLYNPFAASTRVSAFHEATREDSYAGILLKENLKFSSPEHDIPVPSAPKMSPIELPNVSDYPYFPPGTVTPSYGHWYYSIVGEVCK